MTPEAQRIAIAEACGWKHRLATHDQPVEAWWHETNTQHRGVYAIPPDYLSALNACHEAEKVLTPEQQARYAMTLHEMHGIPLATFWHRVICSTAAQRAEAFLRTLNLWDNTK